MADWSRTLRAVLRGVTTGTLADKKALDLSDPEIHDYQRLRQEFEQILAPLAPERATSTSATTLQLIDIVQSRIDEWHTVRSNSVQVALGMFAFSIAGLALISDPSKVPPYVYPFALPFLFGTLITSIVIFVVVSVQICTWYPFIDVSRTWRWFYLYAVATNYPFSFFPTSEQRKRGRVAYLQGLLEYARRTVGMTSHGELGQNLEQLYLLLVYEGYLDQFAMQASRVLVTGLLVTSSSSVLIFVFYLLFLR